MSQLIQQVPLVRYTKALNLWLAFLALLVVLCIFGALIFGTDFLIGIIMISPMIIIVILITVIHIKTRKNSYFDVYSDRVQLRTKFIREHVRRIEASKIEAVDVGDTLLGKKSYGGVLITGSGGTKILAKPVPNQHEIVELVRGIASAPQAKSDASASGSDLAAQIRELQDLRDAGILSEKEFASAKGKLLNS
jgi:hypothetical protein